MTRRIFPASPDPSATTRQGKRGDARRAAKRLLSQTTSREQVPRGSWIWAAASLLCIALIGAIDYSTGPEISFVLFYVPPVLAAAWFGGPRIGLLAALASALAWFVGTMAGAPESSHFTVHCWNGTTRLLIYSVLALLVAAVRRQRDQLRALLDHKTAHLEQEMTARILAEREVMAASAREQRRIAYDLHDDLGQQLVGIAFKAKLLADKLQPERPPEAEDASAIVRLANEAARQVRLTAHKLSEEDEEIELQIALRKLAAELQANCDVRVTVNTTACPVSFSAPVALQLYRIAQEAGRNAIEHGRAKRVEIYLVAHEREVVLTVRDDGCGLDPELAAAKGMGFRIMASRAQAIGGWCEVESSGYGATLTCRVPLPAIAPAS